MKLTLKQEKFCLEYAKCGNATQAYKAAGYKAGKSNDQQLGVNAHRLLKNDKVQARLYELSKKMEENGVASAEEIQQILTKIIRQTLDEEIVITEGTGQGESTARKMTKKADLKDVISAADKLARMKGLYLDKVSIEGTIPVVISGEDKLSD